MIFIVFNGAFNGFDPLILLKIIKNDKHIQPEENLSKIYCGGGGVKELKNNEKSMRINFGMHPLQ